MKWLIEIYEGFNTNSVFRCFIQNYYLSVPSMTFMLLICSSPVLFHASSSSMAFIRLYSLAIMASCFSIVHFLLFIGGKHSMVGIRGNGKTEALINCQDGRVIKPTFIRSGMIATGPFYPDIGWSVMNLPASMSFYVSVGLMLNSKRPYSFDIDVLFEGKSLILFSTLRASL